MATVTLNPVLTSISGTTGRLVFYTRNDKTIVRTWVRPANPNTPAQKANRERFRQAMSSWKALSDDEKKAYNLMAKKQGMAGHNLYISRWMKDRAQEINNKPAMETVQRYVAGGECIDETFRRRVSRYAPTKRSSSPGFHPSVTAPSSLLLTDYARCFPGNRGYGAGISRH
ncbi:MAG TPA: HMG-box domain-containing protein [Spirochaetota bacterium]|nr:HMG-box domain-containing protein [Spirochaetota bacterium]HPI90892.1 HMG-box domain-containing protein [Spirochaetota bacterium]HPR48374.1 HMG-box domain-containing protein [Spirochaetota bacterium]